MVDIQIESILPPFDRPEMARPACAVVSRVDAMGLLEKSDGRIDTLGKPTMMVLLARVRKERIAEQPITEALAILKHKSLKPVALTELKRLLDRINAALEESPLPAKEWQSLIRILEPKLLAGLLHISESSLGRYVSGDRRTPDDAAARLHYLAMVVADLQGAYNEIGVRRWFSRKRSKLDGTAPIDVLSRGWDPQDDGPVRVRQLARALTTSPAT